MGSLVLFDCPVAIVRRVRAYPEWANEMCHVERRRCLAEDTYE